MCIMMHILETPSVTHLDPVDDCDVQVLHPDKVAAARARLAASPQPERIAALFSVLADPTRTRILVAMSAGEVCVCDLAAATRINRSTVSHQLRVLREQRVVRRRRDGRVMYYGLDDDHVAALLAMGIAHAGEASDDRSGQSS